MTDPIRGYDASKLATPWDDAPERIGILSNDLGQWALATTSEADQAVYYIRADIHQAAVAERDRMRAALVEYSINSIRRKQ